MKPLPILLLLGFTAVGTAAGYWLGQRHAATPVRQPSRAEASAAETPVALPPKKDPQTSTAVPMPESLKEVRNLTEIFTSAGPMDRFQAIMAFVNELRPEELERNIDEVREKMRAGGFDPEKMFAMHLLLLKYGSTKPEAALKYLRGQDPFSQMFGTGTVLASYATKDPRKAAEMLLEENQAVSLPRGGSMGAQEVAREWAKQDPSAALEWARGLPEGMRGGALAGILTTLAADDPQRAASIATEIPEGEDRTRVIGQLAEGWAARNPAEALAWTKQLPQADRLEATKRALNGWATEKPKDAAAYVDGLHAAEKDEYLTSVATRWAWTQPAEAAQWLGAQAEGDGKKDATRWVMRSWIDTKPEEASIWLNAQPAGASKDEGIISLADSQMRSDPEAAMAWVSNISDPTLKTQQLRAKSKAWLKKDEAAATNWINNSPNLTPEEKAGLLKQ